MGDVFAIVSKAVFEKQAGVSVGEVWPVASYTATNKVFETTLAGGGRIFMVTVRPPDEQLWLVAVLESPKYDAKKKLWAAAPNAVPVTDISALRPTLKFASGKGMSQDEGTLGMSLQTPRALGDGDADQILALLGGGGKKTAGKASAKAAPASDKGSGKKSTRSTNRVAALLDAIRDAPDDAANRQVLADTYEASGDVDRAQFIRSQVERAALPRWDARTVALELDERGVLATHQAAWHAELPAAKGVSYVGFDRGLVSRVAFDDAALIAKHLPAAMAATPINGITTRWPRRGARPKLGAVAGLRSLVVTGTLLSKADLEWLAKSPILSTIEELTLDHSQLDDEALGALLASPHLTKLRRLRLPFHQISNEGIASFAEAELPQLVELSLGVETIDNLGSGGRYGSQVITSDGVIALCNWPQMAKVECLDLTGSQIGDEGLTAILTSKNTKRLTTLRIRSVSDYDMDNDDYPDVLQAFANAKGGDRALEELDIGENQLTNTAVKALASSPLLDKLKMFAFDFRGDDSLAKMLEGAKWLDEVRVLSLTDTVPSVVKKVLAREPKHLHTMKLASAYPRSNLKGVVAWLVANTQKELRSLDLLGCEVDDAGLKKLGGAVTALPALIALRAGASPAARYSDGESPFSESAAAAFVASPLGKQLRSVALGFAKLDRLPPPAIAGGDDDDDDDEDDDE